MKTRIQTLKLGGGGGGMKTPAIRPIPALKTLTALTLIAALAALILYAALPAGAQTYTDYDSDNDGLIDIRTIAQLQGIRFDHDGNGWIRPQSRGTDLAPYNAAFPNRQTSSVDTLAATTTRMGCPAACIGYELMNNLDFADATTTQRNWTTGYAYAGILEGNGYAISNIIVDPGNASGGLFRQLEAAGVIRNLGMINPTITGQATIAGLAAVNQGAIIASYVAGGTITAAGNAASIGGLVGYNSGSIIASYATATSTRTTGIPSSGAHRSGGLVGRNTGNITASWSAGNVSHSAGSQGTVQVGGLVGVVDGSSSIVADSYCDTTVQATTTPCIGALAGGATATAEGQTTAQLQAPTDYTGIYANWNVDLGNIDADNFPDNPWNFGTTTTYPTLKTPDQRQADPVVDYDLNDNNLIDINNLHQLNAIRHDLNGDGLPDAANYPAYAGAFVNGNLATTTPTTPRMGCPDGCTGYELSQNLDFAADGAAVTSTDPYPNWAPIGGSYNTIFDGNGNTIAHLTINGADNDAYYALFRELGSDGVIRDLGMVDAKVQGAGGNTGTGYYSAILVGNNNGGLIETSYAQGGSVTSTRTYLGYAAALAGRNSGTIRASWTTARVAAHAASNNGAGGIAGWNNGGTVTASFGAGPISGFTGFTGALVAWVDGGTVTGACDLTINTAGTCIGELTQNPTTNAPGATTAQLQALTGYTGAFANLNADLDGDTFPDYPWSFGATTTYPTLYTPSERQTAAALVMDYDQDDDNLIDITNLHQLNAIRYDLNGNGLPENAANYSAYTGGFPNGNLSDTSTPYLGCQSTCIGYELRMDLNFDTDGDGQVGVTTTSTDPYPNWQPITVGNTGYSAIFEGNGRTIARLTLDRSNTDAGLFGELEGGTIRNVGMIDAKIRSGGNRGHGILVGYSNRGTVAASYAQGGSLTITAPSGHAGGLVGRNVGAVRYSYSTAAVNGGAHNNLNIGGLVGLLSHISGADAVITASYAAGATTYTYTGPFPGRVGGLVGQVQYAASRVADSHCDTQATGQSGCIGGLDLSATAAAAGYTTAQLQTPAGYTGPYANWNLDLDSDTFPDYPWNFGTTTTYPTLYTPSERQTAAAVVVDYDQDNDNLIDITNLHQLNALRYDPDGNGLPDNAAHYSAYTGGFPNGNIADTSTPYLGCAAECIGYELTQNLDFAANGATVTANDAYPIWTPIPSYQSTLDGKGHTITRLTINGNHANVGLFAALTANAVIRDLGLIAPAVTSGGASANAGALVGNNAGLITASYIDGGSVTVTGANPYVGGLAGQNAGTGDLRAAYSTAAVTASTTATSTAGGLIGIHSGSLSASYAAGRVTGNTGAGAVLGGLVGTADTANAAIEASYCDTQTTTQPNCIGAQTNSAAVTAEGKTTSELQTPTDYTGIYEAWAITLTPNDDTRYNVWNFGAATDYPTLYQPADRQITITDTLPPPLPRTIPPEPEKPYDPAADHPEIYENTEYEMAATCQTRNVDPETGNPRAATVTFDLGGYTGPILLHLSIWRNGRYMAYETQGIALPTLEHDGQSATLQVDTDPVQTRFRLDGRRNGLAANLVLGYANCRSDDP